MMGGRELSSGQGQVAGRCELGEDLSGFIKCGKFLDKLRNYWLPQQDSGPWNYLFSLRIWL
jgi:hypothetical protein